ncbi:sigma-70 family RNA polymerase sigma factor [Metasolibacillus meyeri]|uniref:Sigma-70 family RNA polymerase sigma factor n=1 Tax=Metasolibacillus meyeri TaxID=1071052 RepID=A0AAW9NM42_9BACL|nr:sigma-70 family RNA polymerase sigma factor [Metasolibacillus meyeri]MEC1177035.1 sigma-70 family RNA polymerase sigma factor [Metasolibacillus meyeri]
MEQIVEQYGEYLYHVSYLYVKDRQLAEEITQDVLFKYAQQPEKFRGEAALKTYLTKIAIHRCYDELRKWKRKNLLNSWLFKKEKNQPSIEHTYIQQESYQTLLDKVLQLPLHYREVIILHYYIEEKVSLIDNIEKPAELKMHVVQPKKQLLFFRDFTILRDGVPLFKPITIDVYPNERFFIEGENGAGKSTLLKFILGVESFETSGDYRIHLPENTSIFHQNSADNVDYLAIVDELTKAEREEYWHMLRQLGIERSKFTDRTSATWSVGQAKKAFLAKALLGQNAVFAWDEVTNHLDLFVIDQLIAAIQKYEPTMIGIDHNGHYVDAIATKKIQLIKEDK